MSNLFFKFVSEILASVALLIIGSALVLIARNCKIQLKTSTSVDETRNGEPLACSFTRCCLFSKR